MLQVALHDQSFRPDPSSTRWQTPTKFEFIRDVAHWDGLSVHVDGHALTPDECDSPHKIAWLHEPPCLGEMHTIYNDIMHISHHYEKVLTYDARLLAMDPGKYKLLPYGGCWIDESEWGMRPKSKLCSMLIGSKMATRGHVIRHEIASLIDNYQGYFFQVDFYGVRGQSVGYERGTKLKVNGDYMFSVVTETCRIDNLFTEWLLDCFAVGTVPVYWGLPNVGKWFANLGVLSFETADECYRIVSSLSVSLYESLLPYVRANLGLMRQYAHPDDTLLYEKYLRQYDTVPAN